jgi:type II secretion system GspH-like protein
MEVIVGALVALIIASVLLRLFNIAYSKYRLNMAISNIAQELEAAREQAIERKQNVSVIFSSKDGYFGLDRNGNGKLDYNEFEELPEEAKLSEDAIVIFTKSGKPASISRQPRIVISNARGSRNVSVSSLGAIEID